MSRRILIVDDDQAFRTLLEKVLEGQYELATATSGEDALVVASEFHPDVVLLDIMMPGMDGYETCRQPTMGASREDTHVVMVSAKSSREEQLRAFEAGADDYVVKPIDPHELRSRVGLHFRLRDAMEDVATLRGEIESHVSDIKQLAVRRSQDIIATQDIAVFTLARVAESRDKDTGEHLLRMRSYAVLLAKQLGREGPYQKDIGQEFLDNLYRSSPLHDIGKVGIPDAILLKPGLLTSDEFETIKQHTVIGADILDEAVCRSPNGGFLEMAAVVARFHHERFDGTGYPAGLIGRDIPLPARIVAVADVFDALTSSRPYKPAYGTDTAKELIEDESGKHFDPAIIEAFQMCYDDFVKIGEEGSDKTQVAVGEIASTKCGLDLTTKPSLSLERPNICDYESPRTR
jgi:putative two-component system response regulator